MKNSEYVLVFALAVAVFGGGAAIAQEEPPPLPICSVDVPLLVTLPDSTDQSGSFVVTPDGCFWKVSQVMSVGDWLSVTNYTWDHSLTNSVSFHADQNDGIGRSGLVYVDNTPVEIFQPGACQVTVQNGGPAEDATVFAASPDCRAVYEINSGSVPVSPDGSTLIYQGVEYGPDENLYVVDFSLGLFRIDLSTGIEIQISTAAGLTNARFNSSGDLIVASNNGITVFHNQFVHISLGIGFDSDDFTVITGSGSYVDVTTLPNGDLLGLTANAVVRFPYQPASG